MEYPWSRWSTFLHTYVPTRGRPDPWPEVAPGFQVRVTIEGAPIAVADELAKDSLQVGAR
jgi:hypothetical protein